MPLTKVAGYRLLRRLGAGGTAEVWEALGAKQESVAVKIARPQDGVQSSSRGWLDEAWIGQHVRHPNLVQVLDSGRDQDTPYLVMERLHGRTLAACQEAAVVPLPLELSVGVALQALAGLAAAHEAKGSASARAGVVHRDIKPSNLFVTEDGSVKVIDFGIARMATDERTQTASGLVRGTVSYLSPEQARGEAVDGRTDLFSLGVVLHELLTGRRAFKRESDAATLTAVLFEPLPEVSLARPEVPSTLASVIQWMTEKLPDARPQSAPEAAQALKTAGVTPWTPEEIATWLRQLPATEPPPEAVGPRRSKRPWPALVAAAAAAILLILVASLASQAHRNPAKSPPVLVTVPVNERQRAPVPAPEPAALPLPEKPAVPAPIPALPEPLHAQPILPKHHHPPTTKPTGFLTIDAKPGFGQVRLDGKDLGPTPIYRREVPAGLHRVEVIRADGQRTHRSARVSSAKEAQVIVQW